MKTSVIAVFLVWLALWLGLSVGEAILDAVLIELWPLR